MLNTQEAITENHTNKPYDNGAIGAIASVASVGVAMGAALGAVTQTPGLLIGAAIGGIVGALTGFTVTEGMGSHARTHARKAV
jgi:hypothetical protein